jgi:hypothetical protein
LDDEDRNNLRLALVSNGKDAEEIESDELVSCINKTNRKGKRYVYADKKTTG